jgi:hypothetical protein
LFRVYGDVITATVGIRGDADVRGTIFYDSNDTSYYVNPNANSKLTTADFIVNASSTIALTSAGTNASQIKAGAGDELYLGGNNTWQMRLSGGNILMDNGGYALSNGSMRAPIFYDSADTAYYGDFNGKSHFNAIAGVRVNRATSEGWAETDAWSVGTQTGYFGGDFTINGSSDENNIAYEDMPSPNGSAANKKGLVWKVRTNSSDSGADGGWNKTIGGVNYNRGYVSVIYVKRVADGNGNFYHGTTTCQNLDGSSNGNPYFQAIGAQSLPLGVWCVSIGYIRGNNDSSTASTSFSGVYRLDTGERILGATDYRFAQSTTSQHRSFLYYASNTSTELWLTNPGFYEINGHEPNINELLMRPEDRVDSLRADVDMRTPLFYDSNNTGTYADLGSTGNSINIVGSLRAATHNKPGIISVSSGTTSAGASIAIQQETSEGWTAIFADFEPNTGWGLYHDNPSNHFLVTSESSSGAIGGGFTVPSRVSGNRTAYTKQLFDQTTGDFKTGRDGYAQGSFRAPIFYDSNDTGYYTHPDGVSRMSAIMTGKASNDSNGIASISLNDGQLLFRTSTDFNHKMWYFDGLNFSTNPSHGHIRFWADSSSRNNGGGGSTIILDSDCQNIVTKIYGQTHSPIYYDLDNTGYYVNPNATTKLAALEFNYTQHGSANNIKMGNSTTMNAISSGSNNAAFGVEALGNCSSGSRNFAYGYAALFSVTSGGNNIAMGDACGYNVSSGSNNLLFGQNAGRTGYQSPQSIGGVSTASNQIHMGNESHSTARIQISWTVNSDSRDKTDVTPINVGLDFVKDLNPVTFRWDKRSDYEDRTPTGENKLEELTLGFLAQEVETVEKSYGYDVANKTNLVVDRDVENDGFGLTYEKMIPILTKAIQELEARVQELENK